jgi:hypothetical protein
MKLSEITKTIEIKIPNSDLIIWIKNGLSWEEQLSIMEIKDPIEATKYLIWKMISKWNLLEDDETPTPITKEIVNSFGLEIVIPLKDAIDKLVKEKKEKKKN